MTTALSLIRDALQEIGILDAIETPSDDDAALALRVLNDLLESWTLDNLTVAVQNNYTYLMTPGQDVYSIGPTGDFTGVRLVQVSGAYTRYQQVDFPVAIIDDQTYNDIPFKFQTGILVQVLRFNQTMPNSEITVWPIPSQALPITLLSNVPFTTAATLTTDLVLGPGYNRAIIKNLAVELAPLFQVAATPLLVGQAVTALGTLKRQNKRTPISQYDSALYDGVNYGPYSWLYQ